MIRYNVYDILYCIKYIFIYKQDCKNKQEHNKDNIIWENTIQYILMAQTRKIKTLGNTLER